MTQQADLELRNQGANMANEFNYGMQSMEAQFNFENTFADSQHGRDIGMLAGKQGEQQRDNISAQGQQDRLEAITQGEQNRCNHRCLKGTKTE